MCCRNPHNRTWRVEGGCSLPSDFLVSTTNLDRKLLNTLLLLASYQELGHPHDGYFLQNVRIHNYSSVAVLSLMNPLAISAISSSLLNSKCGAH